ncbi:MAG: hypothetical protein KKF68_00235 [Nanoarchaeota archaeon]|nr:hypothetical protein [Nanoarchaeota archaeon]
MNKLREFYLRVRLEMINYRIDQKTKVSPRFARQLATDPEAAILHYAYPTKELQRLIEKKSKLRRALENAD